MPKSNNIEQVLTAPVKRSLSDEIVVRIREAIVGGRITPGERLLEESLANSMKVSRGPVREALAQLEREGLVLISPNRGASVVRLSREDFEEVHSLRLALESLAIHEAVRAPDESYFDEMQRTVDSMARSLARREMDDREIAELDVQFHLALVQAAQHKRLLRCWQELRPQIHLLLLARNIIDSDFRVVTIPSHQGILDAVRGKDEALALKMLNEHMRGSYERVARGFSSPPIELTSRNEIEQPLPSQ